MDGKGNVVQRLPPQQPLRLTIWKIVYDLLKSSLLEKSEGEGEATYRTCHAVQNVEEAAGKVNVTYVDLDMGKVASIESDLVIAADGTHSTIRRKVCPNVTPQYAGYIT